MVVPSHLEGGVELAISQQCNALVRMNATVCDVCNDALCCTNSDFSNLEPGHNLLRAVPQHANPSHITITINCSKYIPVL